MCISGTFFLLLLCIHTSDSPLMPIVGKEAEGTLVNGELYLNWTGVFDTTRDVTYSVYAGTDEDYGDVVNQVVTKHTTYRGPCDLAVDRLYLLVQAVYTNGLNELYKAVIHL